ncbi:hypothetical protein EJB05_16144, partial [Eragrostis curvula]
MRQQEQDLLHAAVQRRYNKRFTHEDTSMGHMDDANGYTEDIKNVAEDKHGYKLLTQGYATEASNCHPSLYQSVTSHGTKYTCLEI